MKKLLIIFFLISACGYQPLYIKKNEIFFKEITLLGDKKINRKIISSTQIKKDENISTNNEIILESKIDIITTSRDSKGQPTTFKSLLNVNLIIKENGKNIKVKTFNESFDYNNITNKYDLSVYQDDVRDNLINKIVEDLIIFVNL
tara:strand:- start:108 stop:545 length:438 start_codon:yes stop_codon:yes gene_type:complete